MHDLWQFTLLATGRSRGNGIGHGSLRKLCNHLIQQCAYGPGDYRYEEVPVPELENDHEILVRVEGCGICAGDIKSFDGAPSFWGDEYQPPYIKALI